MRIPYQVIFDEPDARGKQQLTFSDDMFPATSGGYDLYSGPQYLGTLDIDECSCVASLLMAEQCNWLVTKQFRLFRIKTNGPLWLEVNAVYIDQLDIEAMSATLCGDIHSQGKTRIILRNFCVFYAGNILLHGDVESCVQAKEMCIGKEAVVTMKAMKVNLMALTLSQGVLSAEETSWCIAQDMKLEAVARCTWLRSSLLVTRNFISCAYVLLQESNLYANSIDIHSSAVMTSTNILAKESIFFDECVECHDIYAAAVIVKFIQAVVDFCVDAEVLVVKGNSQMIPRLSLSQLERAVSAYLKSDEVASAFLRCTLFLNFPARAEALRWFVHIIEHAQTIDADLSLLISDDKKTLLHYLVMLSDEVGLVDALLAHCGSAQSCYAYLLARDSDRSTALMLAKVPGKEHLFEYLFSKTAELCLLQVRADLSLNSLVFSSVKQFVANPYAGAGVALPAADLSDTETLTALEDKSFAREITQRQRQLQIAEVLEEEKASAPRREEIVKMQTETLKLSVDRFQYQIAQGEILTKKQDKKEISIVNFLSGLLSSDHLKSVTFLPELSAALGVMSAVTAKDSMDLVQLQELAKGVYSSALPGSNIRLLSGLLTAFLGLLATFQHRDMTLIFSPLAILAKCWVEWKGADATALEKSIAQGLDGFVMSARTDSRFTLKEHARSISEFARRSQIIHLNKAALLLTVDVKYFLDEKRARGVDLNTALTDVVYALLTPLRKEELSKENILSLVVANPMRGDITDNYVAYQHVLFIIKKIAESESDTVLLEVAENSEKLLDQAIAKERDQSIERYLEAIKLFARILIAEGLSSEKDSTMKIASPCTVIGMVLLVSCGVYGALRDVVGDKNNFDKCASFLRNTEDVLHGIHAVFPHPFIKRSQACLIVAQVFTLMMRDMMSMKSLSVTEGMRALKNSLEGRADRLALLAEGDEFVSSAGETLRLIERLIAAGSLIKSAYDLISNALGCDLLKQVSGVLPDGNAVTKVIKDTLAIGGSPTQAMAAVKEGLLGSGEVAAQVSGSSLLNLTSALSVCSVVLSVVNLGATIYYGERISRELHDGFLDMQTRIASMKDELIAVLEKTERRLSEKVERQHQTVMNFLQEMSHQMRLIQDWQVKLYKEVERTAHDAVWRDLNMHEVQTRSPSFDRAFEGFMHVLNVHDRAASVYHYELSGGRLHEKYQEDKRIIFECEVNHFFYALEFIKKDLLLGDRLLPNFNLWYYFSVSLVKFLQRAEEKMAVFSVSTEFLETQIRQGFSVIQFFASLIQLPVAQRLFARLEASDASNYPQAIWLFSLYATVLGIPLVGYGEPRDTWVSSTEESKQWQRKILLVAREAYGERRKPRGPAVVALKASVCVVNELLAKSSQFFSDRQRADLDFYKDQIYGQLTPGLFSTSKKQVPQLQMGEYFSHKLFL